jgi:TPR repeat protein
MLRSRSSTRTIAAAIFVSALAFAFPTQARPQESQELAEATQLANAGQATGYYRLGRLYELGREVEKDLYEAARQYQLAAELGHAESQFALGLVLTGALPDSPRSARKSFNWFDKAAQQGHPMAAYFLAMSYETGVGTEPDGEQAFAWYRRAAMSGSSQAMNAVAHMYATGVGIRLNLANAHAWNQVAGARGFEGAARYAAKLEARMSEEDLALARKLVRGLMKKYGGAPPAGPL